MPAMTGSLLQSLRAGFCRAVARALPGGLLLGGLLLAVLSMVMPRDARAATEYRSVGVAAAVLYDGPSVKGRKLFVAPRGMPMEVLSAVGPWVKVRDIAGDVMWVERKDLGNQRTVIATAPVTVRSVAQDTAPAVLQIDRGVVLDLVEPAPAAGWVKVRHREGVVGFARTTDLWGLQ